MDDNHDNRERSRSRDGQEDFNDNGREDRNNDNYGDSRRDNRNDQQQQRSEEVNNLYVTNLSFQTNDESLRAAFEPFGEIHNVSVIKEPVTQVSRGFGFVSFRNLDDSVKAIDAMHGAELDGRAIRVEKARRNNGYQKTPGVYLGPPQLSSRPPRSDSRGRDGGDRRGPPPQERRGGFDSRDVRNFHGGVGGGFRDDRFSNRGGYDRAPGGFREDRFMDGPHGGMRGDPRGFNDNFRGGNVGRDQRFDSRGPPMSSGFDDRRGGGGGRPFYEQQQHQLPRGRSPPRNMDGPQFRGGGGRDRSRSPPSQDDRRGVFDNRGPPPAAAGYGSGASAYAYRGPPRY